MALSPRGLPGSYAAPTGTLHCRRWDDGDEMVVYDPTSGDTHLLSPAAAEVLLALLDSAEALDAAQLAQRLLSGEDDAAPSASDVQALQGVLRQLARLGLVTGADADTAP